MKVNKKTDLAIRILKYLIDKPKDEYISGNVISNDLNISYNHLRRITPLLNELGFTENRYGKDGGVRLSSNASKIPIETLLLKTELNDGCINDCEKCIFRNNCTFERHTKNALLKFCNYFNNVYIQDL